MVPVCNMTHESVIFIQREESKYKVIHYNPNKKERCLVSEDIYKDLKPFSIHGYTEAVGNAFGECTYLVWIQIYYVFTREDKNPFNPRFRSSRLKVFDKKSRSFK